MVNRYSFKFHSFQVFCVLWNRRKLCKAKISSKISLCENCPNKEFFLVHIFPYSNWIRENTDQKKFRIWTLFTQWYFPGSFRICFFFQGGKYLKQSDSLLTLSLISWSEKKKKDFTKIHLYTLLKIPLIHATTRFKIYSH